MCKRGSDNVQICKCANVRMSCAVTVGSACCAVTVGSACCAVTDGSACCAVTVGSACCALRARIHRSLCNLLSPVTPCFANVQMRLRQCANVQMCKCANEECEIRLDKGDSNNNCSQIFCSIKYLLSPVAVTDFFMF